MRTHRALRRPFLGLLAFALSALIAQEASAATAGSGSGYYGKFLGKLNTLHHSVSGDVYAVDSRTLHIRDFTYDGEGPDAFFYAGNTKNPSGSGFRLRDDKGTLNVLGKYKKKHITLTLPEGKTLNNIRWFSVWCREFEVNFADVRIPAGFDFPKPIKIGALGAGVHGVKSDPITIVDAQTLLVPNFSYDGEAPDAKFWVGRGDKPDSQGIRVADENGRIGTPLRRYDKKTLVLTLPGDLTVFDIGHFGVWCEAFAVDFGHVSIPKGPPPPNLPPSLRMLGVSPQKKRPRSFEDDIEINQSESFQVTPVTLPNTGFVQDNRQLVQPFVYSPMRRNFPGPQTFLQYNAFPAAGGEIQATTFRPQVARYQQLNQAPLQSQQVPYFGGGVHFPLPAQNQAYQPQAFHNQQFQFQRRNDQYTNHQFFAPPYFGQYQQ